MQKRQPKSSEQPYKKDPGDTSGSYCAPGSIEQELDMCERGNLKGDEVSHPTSSRIHEPVDSDPQPLTEILYEYNMDMSEDNREGDEMSGDDHSLGLQGGDSELRNQPTFETGLPGDATEHEEMEEVELKKKTAA
jgi:hypothetical protein